MPTTVGYLPLLTANTSTQHCGDILSSENSGTHPTLHSCRDIDRIRSIVNNRVLSYWKTSRSLRQRRKAIFATRFVQFYTSGSVERISRKHVAPRENRQVWGTKIHVVTRCAPVRLIVILFTPQKLLRQNCSCKMHLNALMQEIGPSSGHPTNCENSFYVAPSLTRNLHTRVLLRLFLFIPVRVN